MLVPYYGSRSKLTCSEIYTHIFLTILLSTKKKGHIFCLDPLKPSTLKSLVLYIDAVPKNIPEAATIVLKNVCF